MTRSRLLNGAEASRRFGALSGTYAASLMWVDPLADAAAEALHPFHERWWSIVLDLLERGDGGASDTPAELRALIASLPPEPTAAQWAAMDAGSGAVARAGSRASVVLQCASLLTFCWSPAAARPFAVNGSVLQHPGDRFALTGWWWMALHKPGGMRRAREGYKATLRVRLIHAFLRRMAGGSGQWDRAAFGEPLNQGDLFQGVVALSWLMIDGLQRIGRGLSHDEKEGYYAFWRHTAAVLGLHKTYVDMVNARDCESFWNLWMLTNAGPDGEAVARARALLDVLADAAGGNGTVRRLRRSMLNAAVHQLLGRDIGDRLEIPRTPVAVALLRPLVAGDVAGRLADVVDNLGKARTANAARTDASGSTDWLDALARHKPAV